MMRGECRRCGDPASHRPGSFCDGCSATIDRQIKRWLEGDRDLLLSELAEEVGVPHDVVVQRISRMRRRAGVSHAP